MKFIYKVWELFCRELRDRGIYSISASEVICQSEKYLVLKHDVETNVLSAYKIAKIEHKYQQRGSYYVQAYLLNDEKNIHLLNKMKEMGHEISYHYDVMDSNKGDIDKAIDEFEYNRLKFESNGFSVVTVCQHGNPVIEREGYSSNRDFFRNKKVKSLYPNILDIMVNFKDRITIDYLYFSDAGRCFNLIYDPINNDIVDSSHKNIVINSMGVLLNDIERTSCIVSIHPHRWAESSTVYVIKNLVFKTIRLIAKLMMKVPLLKSIMSKYYYLAKRI